MRNFTEEQNMFRESYRRFLEAEVVVQCSGVIDVASQDFQG